MQPKLWTALAFAIGCTLTSGCVPVAVGAGTAVLVDEIIEEEKGGDGLF